MKKSEIKKQLNSGVLIEITASEHDLIAYCNKDVLYDENAMYTFEKIIDINETDSKIVHLICEKYNVGKVFAYLHYYCSGEFVPDNFTLLAEKNDGNKLFDCKCTYLVSVKKKISDSIPKFEGETIAVF